MNYHKIFDFTWIQNGPPKSFFIYAIPLRKINKSFVAILTKNGHHHIDQKPSKLMDLMMFGM